MPWKVTDAKWLQVESDRVEAIVLMPKFWRRGWDVAGLKEALDEIGLEYSTPELTLINDELHTRNVVADLP